MKAMVTIFFVLATLSIAGCDHNHDNIVYIHENDPPPVPQGVYSITGDGEVFLYWLPIDRDVIRDFSRYIVYRSDSDPDTGYWNIGETTNEYFIDTDAANGHTYYYAVSSIDNDGNLSPLSYEYVFDTPRPEGSNRTIYSIYANLNQAGWNFANEQTVHGDASNCDFFIDDYDGVFYVNAGSSDTALVNNTDIQDMGYTSLFEEIGYAPDAGWSENKWCEAILGHTYVIWTADDHYAKIQITGIGANDIVFSWAYQEDPGNRELKPLPTSIAKPAPKPGAPASTGHI